MAYRDGFALYRLNGVSVPEWLALDRAESIDPIRFSQIENAEIRREFVRKIGMERIVCKLKPRVLDRVGDYELLEIDLRDGRLRPYLKMLNPSTGTWHVEGIPPGISTVEQANRYRAGLEESDIDDIGGADWYQQGDVILRPRGAKKFKGSPIILT